MNKQLILESTFIRGAVGVIYKMAPGYKPRKIDEIVEGIRHAFQTRGQAVMDSHYILVDPDNTYELVESIMKSIPAFNELNLSQHEVDNGITLDDDRPGFAFVSRYDTLQEYYDFVDLDACVRNINSQLYWDWLDNEMFEGRAEIVFKKVPAEN